MLRAFAMGLFVAALVAVGVAGAQDASSADPAARVVDRQAGAVWEPARQRVEAHWKRLEREIAELVDIAAAQAVLVKYVELGGGGRDEALDPRLCLGSGLRALCPQLTETFGDAVR